MVTTLSPNASETPTNPMPTCGNAAAMTALPQPAKVSQNVPIASAAYFFAFMMFLLLLDQNMGDACSGTLKGRNPSEVSEADSGLFPTQIPPRPGDITGFVAYIRPLKPN